MADTPFQVTAHGLQAALATLAPGPVRDALHAAVAEAAVEMEEALRGPHPRSPGPGLPPGQIRPPRQSPLAPGTGLVPINTGRLLSSFDIRVQGTSMVMTADAQDPRSGFFYAEVAHFAGGEDGEAVALVSDEWEAMGARIEELFIRELQGVFG
jgi:hypothetical protein